MSGRSYLRKKLPYQSSATSSAKSSAKRRSGKQSKNAGKKNDGKNTLAKNDDEKTIEELEKLTGKEYFLPKDDESVDKVVQDMMNRIKASAEPSTKTSNEKKSEVLDESTDNETVIDRYFRSISLEKEDSFEKTRKRSSKKKLKGSLKVRIPSATSSKEDEDQMQLTENLRKKREKAKAIKPGDFGLWDEVLDPAVITNQNDSEQDQVKVDKSGVKKVLFEEQIR